MKLPFSFIFLITFASAELSPMVDDTKELPITASVVGAMPTTIPADTAGLYNGDFEEEELDECPLKKNGMFELRADLWWKCPTTNTNTIACLRGVVELVQDNLGQPSCLADTCYGSVILDQIQTLRLFADQLMQSDNDNNHVPPFDHYQELLANVLIQKSLHCHLDTTVLLHLGEEAERSWNLRTHHDTHKDDDDDQREVSAFLAGGGHFYFDGFAGRRGHAKVYYYPKTEEGDYYNYSHQRYQEHREGIMGKLDNLFN